jgi:hypothetical protein
MLVKVCSNSVWLVGLDKQPDQIVDPGGAPAHSGLRSKASWGSNTSSTIRMPSGVEPTAWLMTPSGFSACMR